MLVILLSNENDWAKKINTMIQLAPSMEWVGEILIIIFRTKKEAFLKTNCTFTAK